MSYNKYATREGFEYSGRVCENIRDDVYIVDLLTAYDPSQGLSISVPEDGLNLNLEGLGLKSGDLIRFKREGGCFVFMKPAHTS